MTTPQTMPGIPRSSAYLLNRESIFGKALRSFATLSGSVKRGSGYTSAPTTQAAESNSQNATERMGIQSHGFGAACSHFRSPDATGTSAAGTEMQSPFRNH